MVFSFFMLNAIWVVTIYMLQAQKETINIPWFFPKSYNVSYLLDEDIGPVVEIAENKLIFEPISKSILDNILVREILFDQSKVYFDFTTEYQLYQRVELYFFYS